MFLQPFHFTMTLWTVLVLGLVPYVEANDKSLLIFTTSFESAKQLRIGGTPLDLQSHVTTRFFDFDGNGTPDLWTADGTGRIQVFRGKSTRAGLQFQTPIQVSAGTKKRWGDSYTGVCYAQIAGNQSADLIVAHSGNKISIHTCLGNDRLPFFKEDSIEITVQDNCQGRFDLADWNQDGLLDIITGSFGGDVMWYPNTGTAAQPSFGVGKSFHNIQRAYNSQPRIVDFNQDGKLDLVLGVNWGTIEVYLNVGTPEIPKLSSPTTLRWADQGGALNLRSLNGDDTTPDFVDINQDGVIDLVSGGKNGRVFVSQGVGVTDHLRQLQALLKVHPTELGNKMADDDALRGICFGFLGGMQSALTSGLVPEEQRQQVIRDLQTLVRQYPHYFKRQKFDLEKTPHLPSFAAQMWIVLFEANPDSLQNRTQLADLAGFKDGYRDLLVKLGIIFIDNHTATAEQVNKMVKLLESMPRAVWDVETITVRGWLGDGFKQQGISSRTGVNIFSLPLGRAENSFPADAPRRGITDVYMICLAHEIAHNMLDTIGKRLRPELFELKYEQLEYAAGELVKFHPQKSRGVNWNVTKSNLRTANIWDGQDSTWATTWKSYLESEPFKRAHVRGSVHFFIHSPQEAFATLANQYFTDSQLMLELGVTRWQDNHKASINQFLLIADYLSQKSDSVKFYRMGVGGDLQTETVTLQRNQKNQIIQLESRGTKVAFKYEGNLVSDLILSDR